MGLFSCSKNAAGHINAFSFLFLFLLVSNQLFYSIQGRPMLKFQELATGGEGEGMLGATMIGSRPPRCSVRCFNCGRCEAVQVPAVPQDKSGLRGGRFPASSSMRGGDEYGSSNYKPLSWKCKCGGVIINP